MRALKFSALILGLGTFESVAQHKAEVSPVAEVGSLAVDPSLLKCAKDIDLAEAEADYRTLFSPAANVGRVVYGRELRGSSAELDILAQSLGQKAPWRWPSLRCETAVHCLEQLLGSREAAYRLLNIARRTGYVPAIDQSESPENRQRLWKVSELRSLDRTLRALPPALYRLPTLQKIYRVAVDPVPRKGPPAAADASAAMVRQLEMHADPAKLRWSVGVVDKRQAPGKVRVFNSTFGGIDEERHTFLHELGHHFDFTHSLSASKEFRDLVEKEGSVSNYGQTAYEEAFAELFAEFLIMPEVVELKAPRQYRFMREVFRSRSIAWPPPPADAAEVAAVDKMISETIRPHLFLWAESSSERENPRWRGFINVSNASTRYFDDVGFERIGLRAKRCQPADIASWQRQKSIAQNRVTELNTLFTSLFWRAESLCLGRRWDECLSVADLRRVYESNSAYRKLGEFFGGPENLFGQIRSSRLPLKAQIRMNLGIKGDKNFYFGPPSAKSLEILLDDYGLLRRPGYLELYEYFLTSMSEEQAQLQLADTLCLRGLVELLPLLQKRSLLPSTRNRLQLCLQQDTHGKDLDAVRKMLGLSVRQIGN